MKFFYKSRMTTRVRYDRELLDATIARDGATLVGEYATLNRETKINFICKCGKDGCKAFVYMVSCSTTCPSCTNKIRKEKLKITNITKYGVEHVLQNKTIREQIKQTNLERYGTTCSAQNNEVKQKCIETNLLKYGTEHPTRSKIVQERTKNTNVKKYGVERPAQSRVVKEKTKTTNLEKYGFIAPAQSKEVYNKIIATNLEKYGVEFASQTKEFRDRVKSTNIYKYGVEFPTQCVEVRDKVKAKCISRFGTENPNQVNEIKDKIKNTNIQKYGVTCTLHNIDIAEKVKLTNIERFGVDHPWKSLDCRTKIKSTMIEKYGVENPSQNPELFEKAQRNAKKFKEYKMPSGALRKVQGYEPFALDELLKTYTEDQIKTDRKDVGRIGYEVDGKAKYYFPDIAIPHENKIIEVKSTWTYRLEPERIKQKAEATRAKGFNYEIWVFDSKGNRVNVDLEETEDCDMVATSLPEEAAETNVIVYE